MSSGIGLVPVREAELARTLLIFLGSIFIVCHFCSSRRFEPFSTKERRKIQAQKTSRYFHKESLSESGKEKLP